MRLGTSIGLWRHRRLLDWVDHGAEQDGGRFCAVGTLVRVGQHHVEVDQAQHVELDRSFDVVGARADQRFGGQLPERELARRHICRHTDQSAEARIHLHRRYCLPAPESYISHEVRRGCASPSEIKLITDCSAA